MSKKYVTIEKYDFHDFEIEKKPYTQILNDVIQRATHIQATFLWIYLQSLSETWQINKKHIMKRFSISSRTYERWMSYLHNVKLIDYRQIRYDDGTFGKCTMVALNGLQFAPEADSIHNAKFGGAVVTSIESAQSARDHRSAKKPRSGETAAAAFDAHINKTKISKKEVIKETNKTEGPIVPVSVFSNSLSVKNHILTIINNRGTSIDEDIVDQIVYYIGGDTNYDAVVKKINIALKKIREGNWNIPHGYKGITSHSIREKEKKQHAIKQEQYRQDASAFRTLKQSIVSENQKTQLTRETSSTEPTPEQDIAPMPQIPSEFSDQDLETISHYKHALGYNKLDIHFPNLEKRAQAAELFEKAQSLIKKQHVKKPMQRLGDVLCKKSA